MLESSSRDAARGFAGERNHVDGHAIETGPREFPGHRFLGCGERDVQACGSLFRLAVIYSITGPPGEHICAEAACNPYMIYDTVPFSSSQISRSAMETDGSDRAELLPSGWSTRSSAEHDTLRKIGAINDQLSRLKELWADSLDVSVDHINLILAVVDLDRGKGVTTLQAAKSLMRDVRFVVGQAKQLEILGYLAREIAPWNSRMAILSLTQEGRARIQRLRARPDPARSRLFEALDDTSLEEFYGALEIIERKLLRVIRAQAVGPRSEGI